MGIGFVILIHLFAIFILSVIIAVIGSIVVYFFSKKKKKRKILLAFIAPFIGFYTLYICAIIGSGIVSEVKKVDIGIGDSWYVPLGNNHQLLFIDSLEQAFITKENGETIISEILLIEKNGNQIFGETYNRKYFSYNTKTNELKQFDDENNLVVLNSNNIPKLIKVGDFYTEKRTEIAGFWLMVVGVLSLIISFGAVYLLKEIIYYFGFKSFRKSTN